MKNVKRMKTNSFRIGGGWYMVVLNRKMNANLNDVSIKDQILE